MYGVRFHAVIGPSRVKLNNNDEPVIEFQLTTRVGREILEDLGVRVEVVENLEGIKSARLADQACRKDLWIQLFLKEDAKLPKLDFGGAVTGQSIKISAPGGDGMMPELTTTILVDAANVDKGAGGFFTSQIGKPWWVLIDTRQQDLPGT